MPVALTFLHPGGGWDFVSQEDLAGRQSLGEKIVSSPGGGLKTSHKVAAPLVRSDALFPDDYDDSAVAVAQYVQHFNDSHAPVSSVSKVYGSGSLAKKFAAMMDAEYCGEVAPE